PIYSTKSFLLNPNKTGIIAEYKRKSPSKGIINDISKVQDITKGYENFGASAISVLTDNQYFGGCNDDILNIRNEINIPILRKDFIVDEYQVYETKSIGADLILLIAECLTQEEVNNLSQLAKNIGLEVLLEMHSENEIEKINENIDIIEPFTEQLNNRFKWFENTVNYINQDFGSIEQFASAYEYFGFNYDEDNKGWWFREWAPNAYEISLIGEFNDWNHQANYLNRKDFGVWEIFLPDSIYKNKLIPFSKVKLKIRGINGYVYRIPAYIRRVVQNEDSSFDGQFIPNSNFQWTDKSFKCNLTTSKHPIIYESHIGMATEEFRIGTYREFADNILPRIKNLGYNAVQLMAVMEHPYYGSFGYQVSNFYAPSSRFGTPDDLRYLINKSHQLGISVILDVVHSHSVKNLIEGLSEFDGTEIYFNGHHPDWDSKLFDYGRI
ncbi:unnamed protein product, partial [Darwinula stevensoni]